MLYFLRDADSSSPVREAWRALMQSHPREMVRLLAHIERVELAKYKSTVSGAELIGPDLYYFSVGQIYVVYSIDEDNVVILSVGEANSPAERHRVIQDATRRLPVA